MVIHGGSHLTILMLDHHCSLQRIWGRQHRCHPVESSHKIWYFAISDFFFILYVVYIPPYWSLSWPASQFRRPAQELSSSSSSSEIWKGRKENLSLFMDRSLLMKLEKLFKTESWHATNCHIILVVIPQRSRHQQPWISFYSAVKTSSLFIDSFKTRKWKLGNILESSETQTSNPKRFRQNRCYSYLHISYVFIFILWILF